ncbi:cytochrome P450 [Rhodococcus sp. HNM0569]|uniref:cytochrome P450 n=1 Tax=Rhodococcus sp. HNM0569 TaxID=2716340 RepID=UPI00146D8993|nr:cytochrome P450 [Rhodococcus sp. HNM0569]NLU84879.1 cytochrome P450 [Rhodococcus sp. HNM0569]
MTDMHAPQPDVTLPLHTDGPLDAPTEWGELRDRCPVAVAELPSGDTALYLTRYDDVRTLLSDPRFARPTANDAAARLAPAGAGGVVADGRRTDTISKGESHIRWRRLVGKYFTAKRMSALRPEIAALAHELVYGMLERGAPADIRADLGFPLPVYVICDVLGVPAADRARFSHWSDSFLNVSRYSSDEAAAAQEQFEQYMTEHIRAKRADPADDILSMLVAESADEGAGLTDEELLFTGMGLLVAGHETTANMIGKTVSMLLADRSRWERLLADRSLVRTAVEETLRLDANFSFGTRRFVTEDVEIDGHTIPGGSTVVCSLSAANRDTAAYHDADAMDLGRAPNPHLTFGAGPHSCLGQALARTELQVVLDTLLDRIPTLHLATPVEDLRKTEGLLVGGLTRVPVAW